MDTLTARAITAAVEVARGLGLRVVTPALLRDGSNVLVHLAPSPVVARVATTTGLLRQPAAVWLQRDLDVASYLHSVGAPVVPPSTELPPGPHVFPEADGPLALSFWTFVEHDRNTEVAPEEAMASLHQLHAALRGCPVEVPYLGLVLDEIPRWLKWLEKQRALSGADLVELRAAHWDLATQLRPSRTASQVLHGDAHRGNLLRTPQGLLWTDFEDTGKGPVAWDVATFLYQEVADPQREAELLALYPGAPSARDLVPFRAARVLEAVVYVQVLAQRFPARAAEAAQRLAAWQRRRLS